MEAVEFLRKAHRMCSVYVGCNGCPCEADTCFISGTDCRKNPENVVAAVEQWSKDHPIKTRQSEFLKQYPNAQIKDDVLWMCPKYISYDYRPEENCHEISCGDCKRKFWLTEVTDND